ncbi:unnamed protein product [Caenorhabditis auriculariae]|uniref:Uncharacterized protein n=1 Tax=Caenorhabditis auriculariae TaxID=2777116 RepID=A0A8S1H9L6_9PELO|nr:unnamed protein product [Caenorhabditis auriculariae]
MVTEKTNVAPSSTTTLPSSRSAPTLDTRSPAVVNSPPRVPPELSSSRPRVNSQRSSTLQHGPWSYSDDSRDSSEEEEREVNCACVNVRNPIRCLAAIIIMVVISRDILPYALIFSSSEARVTHVEIGVVSASIGGLMIMIQIIIFWLSTGYKPLYVVLWILADILLLALRVGQVVLFLVFPEKPLYTDNKYLEKLVMQTSLYLCCAHLGFLLMNLACALNWYIRK